MVGTIGFFMLVCVIMLIITIVKYIDFFIKKFEQDDGKIDLNDEANITVLMLTPILLILLSGFTTWIIIEYINC